MILISKQNISYSSLIDPINFINKEDIETDKVKTIPEELLTNIAKRVISMGAIVRYLGSTCNGLAFSVEFDRDGENK